MFLLYVMLYFGQWPHVEYFLFWCKVGIGLVFINKFMPLSAVGVVLFQLRGLYFVHVNTFLRIQEREKKICFCPLVTYI